MKQQIPIWEKSNLTLDEAAAYFNVGINKLREMLNQKECEPYILWVGNRRLIKRKSFEQYLEKAFSI